MVPSEQQFDVILRRVVLPVLSAAGFARDERDDQRDTIVRRSVSRGGFDVTQIIEFQIGERSLDGRFTITLGVFSRDYARTDVIGQPETCDCLFELTKRLGFLFDPPKGLLSRLLGRRRRDPQDYWWELSDRSSVMEKTMVEVLNCIVQNGVPWLDEMSTRDRFAWAAAQAQERKNRLASRRP